MSNENITFEELLNDSLNKNKKLGKVAEGKVISINNKCEIFVDLNYKADGIVPKSEFSFNENENPKDFFKPGDSITCEVLKLNDGEGNVLLSYKRYKSKIEKEKFEEKINNDDIFEEKVSDINSTGAIVNCYGSRVFIPISLLGGTNNAVEKGSIVRFKIIEYNPKEHKIIGSCKKVLEEEKNQKEQEFWNNAEIGKEYSGVVTSVCSYGAFVEIEGVQGLLHISEISWEKNANANDFIKQGQKIKVKIKALDKENKRIQLCYDGKGVNPWTKINYKIGDIVTVKIRKIMPYGAFAELQKGIDGLIHISQICEHKISKPEEVLKVGEKVNAKIIELDPENEKIELSIRELEGTSNEYNDLEEQKKM